MKETLDRILGIVEKIKEDQTDLKINMAEIRKDISQNTIDLQENAEDIAHHIVRTDLLENRIDLLEEPKKIKKYIYQGIVGAGALAATTYGIIELLSYLRGIL